MISEAVVAALERALERNSTLQALSFSGKCVAKRIFALSFARIVVICIFAGFQNGLILNDCVLWWQHGLL